MEIDLRCKGLEEVVTIFNALPKNRGTLRIGTDEGKWYENPSLDSIKNLHKEFGYVHLKYTSD